MKYMNLFTDVPAGATHVLGRLSVCNRDWLTLRQINENGYYVYKTQLGQMVLRVPYQELHGDCPDAYWEVLGFYNEADGEVAKSAFAQHATLNGRDVMRNLRSEELVVLKAA